MYEITEDKSVIYLYGTIHLAKPDAFPLDTIVENAFATCSNIVFEINLANVDFGNLFVLASYQDTTLLENVVPRKYYRIIDSLFKANSFPKFIYNKFKPWFAVIVLLASEMLKGKPEFGEGVEMYLYKKMDTTKNILELESYEEQLKIFEEIYHYDSETFFEFFLSYFIEDSAQDVIIYETWLEGNESKLLELIESRFTRSPFVERFYYLLLDKRNEKMANKIESFIRNGGCYFVALGAGHLLGKKGIVSLLKNKGFKVKRLI
ncbi:MAG: TraB/GumN family protein [Ignavibacteria bacterium]|nr:TraB/GumN family protein [Ignavibacteria bacterium]